jgi:predicted transposase/invertase (TIGR01784 family)
MRHDTENWLLHNAIQSIFVDLTKLNEVIKKPITQMTDMESLSVFLRYADNPDYRDVVNKVIETREALAVAGEVLMSVSKDERERAILHSRRMAQRDLESNLATAERIGRTEGERAKALSIAHSALIKGMSIADIADITGLTYKEIEDLRILN